MQKDPNLRKKATGITRKRLLQKTKPPSDDAEKEEEEKEKGEEEEDVAAASSLRPAKRARVATLKESNTVPPASASRLPPRQRGLGIQVGERLEVEWNGSYYLATVDAITFLGLLNVT